MKMVLEKESFWFYVLSMRGASQVALVVKNMPANAGDVVQSLGWEDPLEGLEKATAPHSSTLAWKIPRMEEPGRLQSMGSQRVRYD